MRYDAKTALLVVDVQNDFASPDGSLSVAGGEDVIGFVNGQVEKALAAGATIVYTQDWHPESTPHFAKDGGIWPVHCVGGTGGAELHPSLFVPEGAVKIRKGTAGEDGYSAFYVKDPLGEGRSSTGLASVLRDKGVTSVVVVGLALDYCVKDSAADSVEEGFTTTLLADGTRSVNLAPGDGSRAVAALVAAGVNVE